ncbi:hypothetical protein R1sor_003714 [Riccia sorocarpa]|uniref:Actin-binding transcription modulator n=1 Tax=Riccia sorocarpa TaxID=122646 RepID=A0ABD3H574_9MARC
MKAGESAVMGGGGPAVNLKEGGERKEDGMEVELTDALAIDSSRPSHVPISLDLYPAAHELPPRPPPANECNYTHYYAIDVGKPFHDQYVFRHHNGLCVIGLASTHAAFMIDTEITGVDYNVGKTSRAEIKAVGKRKKNAQVLEGNSALCKVMAGETFFLVRCCVRGTLLEVNERLIKEPHLLVQRPDTEGYVAIMMPRPEDWKKAQPTFLTPEQYKERRGIPAISDKL